MKFELDASYEGLQDPAVTFSRPVQHSDVTAREPVNLCLSEGNGSAVRMLSVIKCTAALRHLKLRQGLLAADSRSPALKKVVNS